MSDQTPDEETSLNDSEPRRLTLRRSRFPFEINTLALLTLIGLVVLTVGLVLFNLGLLPSSVLRWWPLLLLIPSFMWFLATLFRRRIKGLLGSTALLGISVSLLLAAQNVAPPGATLIGVLFITVGAGLLLRGLLLSQQPLG